MDNAANYQDTQVDKGWRERTANQNYQTTQVDKGWRERTANQNYQTTQIDKGWRERIANQNYQTTQIDKGWRERTANQNYQTTQIDKGWREKLANPDYQKTQVDKGWREKAGAMFDPSNIMNQATANYFFTINDFKDACEKLTELKSSENNIYKIKRTISRSGGESIILLCSDCDGKDVAAKIYYEPVNSAGSSISTRTYILEYMGTEEGQRYTLAVSDIGLVEFGESRYYFEIMPYCSNGDISRAGAMPFDELVSVIKQLNEALHSIHKAGIFHRDIKPQNIFKTAQGIVLSDFGTARIAEPGNVAQTEHVVRTFGYTAPELLLGISDEPTFYYTYKCDYYSLGVTIATLFEGHFVYEGMNNEMIMSCIQNSKMPLSRTDIHREQLENLLNGLCQLDARYRFGYENVNSWLIDHNYTTAVLDGEWPRAYRVLHDAYRDEQSMFEGMTQNEIYWEEAKAMLYSKNIEQFFVTFRSDIARNAQIADDNYRMINRDKGLAFFLKRLFPAGPIVWRGYTFNSLIDLGNSMVLTEHPRFYSEILQNQCISDWLHNTRGISVEDDTLKLVDNIEAFSNAEPEISCYWFGNSFASAKKLRICGHEISTIADLIVAMFERPADFYQMDGYQKLLDRKTGADLYGFLYSFGYQEIIERVWEDVKTENLFNKMSILMAMIESIAVRENVNPGLIRKFFVEYGPVGLATYTQKLVLEKGKNKVYMPLDADGKYIMDKIANFHPPVDGNISELFKAYTPLIESVEKLRQNLIENPHCILTGIYDNRGILCTNIAGCFAFKIFDCSAPLGFCTWLESAEGGKNK